jgi:hypothetical protein
MDNEKMERLIEKLESAPAEGKTEVLLEVVACRLGAPIPEWWRGGESAIEDIYALHGIEAILATGDALKEEVKWREEQKQKAAQK